MENSPDHSLVTLEERLTAATFDPSCRPQFYKWLPESSVYMGVTDQKKLKRGFHTVRRSGAPHIAVFTSEKMVPSKYKVARIKFGDFLSLATGGGISLNPGQPVTKDFSEAEIEAIQNGELCNPTRFEKGDLYGRLPLPPLKSRLIWKDTVSLLKNHPLIVSAWSADLTPPTLQKTTVSPWLGLVTNSALAWYAAAQECTILLNTLDDSPSSFKIERIRDASDKPPEAECFYARKNREEQ